MAFTIKNSVIYGGNGTVGDFASDPGKDAIVYVGSRNQTAIIKSIICGYGFSGLTDYENLNRSVTGRLVVLTGSIITQLTDDAAPAPNAALTAQLAALNGKILFDYKLQGCGPFKFRFPDENADGALISDTGTPFLTVVLVCANSFPGPAANLHGFLHVWSKNSDVDETIGGLHVK